MTFFRYLVVQVLAYGLDIGGFLIGFKLLGADPIISNVFGKIVAGVFAFIAHRNFTFQSTQKIKHGEQAIRYFALLGLNIPLSSLVLLLVLLAISYPLYGKVISDAICLLLTYWLSKTYVFCKPRDNSLNSNTKRGDR
ncbi:GtrA family protein [Pollutimonas nitritireducens]|uniref:GtrA family protein n=2 Tax=Pollutimonas nitritireducens TaxID=2045209 RepID=A0A2N4UBU9_9BURK|nr:GtrA family protein [Pollutimonas nitritireducens]